MNLIFHMTTHRPRQPQPDVPASMAPDDPNAASAPVKCQDCGKEFATKYQAKKHYLRRHFQGEKPFACTKCNKKRFVVKEDLTMHMKSCGNVYMCTCGINLCSLGALKRHCKYFSHEPKSYEPQPDTSAGPPSPEGGSLEWNQCPPVEGLASLPPPADGLGGGGGGGAPACGSCSDWGAAARSYSEGLVAGGGAGGPLAGGFAQQLSAMGAMSALHGMSGGLGGGGMAPSGGMGLGGGGGADGGAAAAGAISPSLAAQAALIRSLHARNFGAPAPAGAPTAAPMGGAPAGNLAPAELAAAAAAAAARPNGGGGAGSSTDTANADGGDASGAGAPAGWPTGLPLGLADLSRAELPPGYGDGAPAAAAAAAAAAAGADLYEGMMPSLANALRRGFSSGGAAGAPPGGPGGEAIYGAHAAAYAAVSAAFNGAAGATVPPPAAGGGAGGGLGGGLLNPSALGHWGTAAHPKGADGMAAATLGEMLMQEHTKRQRLDG